MRDSWIIGLMAFAVAVGGFTGYQMRTPKPVPVAKHETATQTHDMRLDAKTGAVAFYQHDIPQTHTRKVITRYLPRTPGDMCPQAIAEEETTDIYTGHGMKKGGSKQTGAVSAATHTATRVEIKHVPMPKPRWTVGAGALVRPLNPYDVAPAASVGLRLWGDWTLRALVEVPVKAPQDARAGFMLEVPL